MQMQTKNNKKQRFSKVRQSIKLAQPLVCSNRQRIQQKINKIQKKQHSADNHIEDIQTPLIIEENLSVYQEKYQNLEKIGQGSNGIVKKCMHRGQKKIYAMKSMLIDQQHIYFLKRNFQYVKSLNHQNIISYKSLYIDRKKHVCNLVMEYCNYPNLLRLTDLGEKEIKKIVYSLLKTIFFMHSKNICHRDIKPQNILYNRQKQQIKIIDFGISKKLMERNTKKQMLTVTGTLYYKAPQMFNGGRYDQRIDIWAAGITLYKLIVGKTPFQSQYLSDTIQNIVKGQLQFDEAIWSQYSKFLPDLIRKMLKPRQQRISLTDAMKHLWFLQSSGLFESSIKLSRSLTGQNVQFIKLLNNHSNLSSKNNSTNLPDSNSDLPRLNSLLQTQQMAIEKWIFTQGQQNDLIQSEQQIESPSK